MSPVGGVARSSSRSKDSNTSPRCRYPCALTFARLYAVTSCCSEATTNADAALYIPRIITARPVDTDSQESIDQTGRMRSLLPAKSAEVDRLVGSRGGRDHLELVQREDFAGPFHFVRFRADRLEALAEGLHDFARVFDSGDVSVAQF